MKKITKTILILAIATATIMPAQTFAFTPGYGSEFTCKPSTMGGPAKGESFVPWCKVTNASEDNTKRIYDLEVYVNTLEKEIAEIRNQKAQEISGTYSASESQQLINLTNRVTVLERTVDFIINQVSSVLAEVIRYISK